MVNPVGARRSRAFDSQRAYNNKATLSVLEVLQLFLTKTVFKYKTVDERMLLGYLAEEIHKKYPFRRMSTDDLFDMYYEAEQTPIDDVIKKKFGDEDAVPVRGFNIPEPSSDGERKPPGVPNMP